jgi:hypothetical protein
MRQIKKSFFFILNSNFQQTQQGLCLLILKKKQEVKINVVFFLYFTILLIHFAYARVIVQFAIPVCVL